MASTTEESRFKFDFKMSAADRVALNLLNFPLDSNLWRILCGFGTVVMVGSAWGSFKSQGFGLTPITHVVAAVVLGNSAFGGRFNFALMSAIYGSIAEFIVVTDQELTVEIYGIKKRQSIDVRRYSWASPIALREAVETDYGFLFEGGKGKVLIPKHVFSSDEEQTQFREFVANKMEGPVSIWRDVA